MTNPNYRLWEKIKAEDAKAKNDKWKFCQTKICYYCLKEIKEEDVKNMAIVTSCPYCHKSFVE